MKKPIKPKEPKKPTKPEKVKTVMEERIFWCCSLQNLLDLLAKDGRMVYDYATVERQDPLDYSQIYFQNDSESDVRVSFKREYKYTFTDDHFQKELVKYRKALVAYQVKYAAYEEKMKQYMEEKAVYEETIAQKRQEAELAEFERLKKLYGFKRLNNEPKNSTPPSS